jgi:hypothetical protein
LKALFFIIFLVSLNSCIQNKKEGNDKINSTSIQNNIFIENKENYKNQLLSFVRDYINEGYYVDRGKILFLTKNENTIIIQNFNIINDEEIYTKIITFNILYDNIEHKIIGEGYNRVQREIITVNNENIYSQLNLTTEKRKWIDASLIIKNDGYSLRTITWWYPRLELIRPETKDDIWFLSNIIDESVIKYTYDFQKKYTGTYIYDSYKLFEITIEEFNAKYNNEDKKVEKIINIDNNGFLFVDDGFGEQFYYGDWKAKIINEDKETALFGHAPAYGTSVQLYFLDGDIIWEVKVDPDHDYMKYQIIYKRK